MLDISYIALCSTLVPVLRVRGHYGYTDLKNQVFLILSFLHLSAGLLCYGSLPIPTGNAATVLFAYLALLSVSCAWSDNVEDSVRDLPRWWTLFYFFVVCGRVDSILVLEAVFVPSVFVAVYGLIQQWFAVDPFLPELREIFRTRKKRTRLYSWLGNSNYAGAYLVPCFFAGLYLCTVSPWWALGLVPVWLAIGWSECRAAWLATISGLALANIVLYWHPLLAVGALACILAVVAISLQRIEPTVGRFYYMRSCLMMLEEAPLFGWGPRAFRRRYFEMQARMNEKDPSILGKPGEPGKNTFPIGKRAHCDHFETLAESGLVGYALWAAFYISVIVAGSDNVLIMAGVVAALINATFFYSLRTGATALPFFALAATLAPGAQGAAHVALPYAALITVVAGYLTYRLAYVPMRAGLFYWDAQFKKDPSQARELVGKALALDPHNNMYLSLASILHMPQDAPGALLAGVKLLDHNDGQKVAWAVLDQVARVAYLNGAYELSRNAIREAIRLNPSVPEHYQVLSLAEDRLREIKEAIRMARQQREAA